MKDPPPDSTNALPPPAMDATLQKPNVFPRPFIASGYKLYWMEGN